MPDSNTPSPPTSQKIILILQNLRDNQRNLEKVYKQLISQSAVSVDDIANIRARLDEITSHISHLEIIEQQVQINSEGIQNNANKVADILERLAVLPDIQNRIASHDKWSSRQGGEIAELKSDISRIKGDKRKAGEVIKPFLPLLKLFISLAE